jgi:hypothetical protein
VSGQFHAPATLPPEKACDTCDNIKNLNSELQFLVAADLIYSETIDIKKCWKISLEDLFV